MDRLTVLCFAGTYGLALICELARFAVRSAARWYLTVGLTALAWVVQTAYLVNLARVDGRMPVTTPFESLLVLSWIFAAIGLYLMVRAPKPVAVGTFVLPLVLALTAVAGTSSLPRQPDWGSFGRGDGVLGVGAWGLPAGGGGQHVRGVRGGADVPGAGQPAQAEAGDAVRVRAAEPGTVGAAQPRGDHAGVPAAHVRPADRAGPERRAVAARAAPGWTDPKVMSALAMWLVVRRLAARPVPAGDAGQGGDAADDRRVRVPGVHLGRRRGAAPAHGARDVGLVEEGAVRLVAVGVDHRSAPASVREALAFDGPKGPEGLEALARTLPGHRVRRPLDLQSRRGLRRGRGGDRPRRRGARRLPGRRSTRHAAATFADHWSSYHDEAVVGHLFRVAASLESLVLGEGQILGQVREAFRAAREGGTVGPILHRVFENALRVGKKVREETGMDQGKLSVASVAVDVAREVFDTFSDKTVLVIGAGKMADLTLAHLTALRPGKILVTNRSPERAEAAAERWGGQAVPFDRLEPRPDRGRRRREHHRRGGADRRLRAVCARPARPAQPAGPDPGHRHPPRLRRRGSDRSTR